MVWIKRIIFTVIYISSAMFLINVVNISPVIVLIPIIAFSGFISRNGIFAGVFTLLGHEK